ncbi:MAG: bifunctional glycosyltransferase family 2/GtrA family protein [Solirubrobacterales bacterium]|nr:bifunctional glycosyltransferase family 2/GtrA family protein [Solirubrobacterales bacterium]
MNTVVADRTQDAGVGWPLPPPACGVLDVEIVVPVYNEERALAASIHRLHELLSSLSWFAWQITIADNASTDRTPEIARELAAELRQVRVLRLEQKGRGRALRAAWSASEARVVAYMDVDLSTDLRALLPLIAPLLSGHSEIAIGSRLARGSRVTRGLKRELISRLYNRILRTVLRARFSAAECGFKAVRADRARDLLDAVRDNGWFFDTELLVRAQRRGMRIHEVAFDWVEDPDSRVDIVATALADLRGVARLAIAAPIARFLAVGVASTLAYALLFVVLAGALGSVAASALALAVTAVANTAANRRLTFGVRGREGLARQHLAGLLVFLIALALTNGALSVLHGLDGRPARLLEAVVLVVAGLAATVTRYVALATWVFRPRRAQECRTAPIPLPIEGR